MKKTVAQACLSIWLLLCGCSMSGEDHRGPDEARLINSDIDLFWAAYDAAYDPQTSPAERASIFQTQYFDQGSAGLRTFASQRIGSAAALVNATNQFQGYYTAIRASTMQVSSGAVQQQIRAGFLMLEDLYPDAYFPDVYFLIGRMSTGGTVSDEGLLIGTELFSRTPTTPTEELTAWHKAVTRSIDRIPAIVAHELVHFQQSYLGRTETLLEQSIMEGSADFMAEKLVGFHVNEHLHIYAAPIEAEIWTAFRAARAGRDYSEWLYNANQTTDRPADLGYYVGYKICEAFYEQSTDKRAAIAEILNISDFEGFLEQSGYARKVASAKHTASQALDGPTWMREQ